MLEVWIVHEVLEELGIVLTSNTGLTLTGTTDAMVVSTSSRQVTGAKGNLAAVDARVTRLRLGLDLGGGITLSSPDHGLSAEPWGRGLLSHAAEGFQDRGFSGSLSWQQ